MAQVTTEEKKRREGRTKRQAKTTASRNAARKASKHEADRGQPHSKS